MKKSIKYFLFAAMIVFMTACPFEAPFPIDEPSIKYSSSMIGNWAEESELENEFPSYFAISDVDGYSFKIEEYTYDEEEDSWSTGEYGAHLSEVGDHKFINIYDVSMETWYFYRLDWDDPDQFSLYAVTEYIDEGFDSSAEMKIFFEKYCDLSFFYQGAEKYMRIE
jgi:hypothetical protein